MSVDSHTEEMRELFEQYLVENEKFSRGNGAAGARARKALMGLKKSGDARRKEIQEIKNAAKAAK